MAGILSTFPAGLTSVMVNHTSVAATDEPPRPETETIVPWPSTAPSTAPSTPATATPPSLQALQAKHAADSAAGKQPSAKSMQEWLFSPIFNFAPKTSSPSSAAETFEFPETFLATIDQRLQPGPAAKYSAAFLSAVARHCGESVQSYLRSLLDTPAPLSDIVMPDARLVLKASLRFHEWVDHRVKLLSATDADEEKLFLDTLSLRVEFLSKLPAIDLTCPPSTHVFNNADKRRRLSRCAFLSLLSQRTNHAM